ncbi:putative clathrin assembly protein [Trifolium repens]|nr:putative clathrin assembly protein [Trifolium repens]
MENDNEISGKKFSNSVRVALESINIFKLLVMDLLIWMISFFRCNPKMLCKLMIYTEGWGCRSSTVQPRYLIGVQHAPQSIGGLFSEDLIVEEKHLHIMVCPCKVFRG